MDEPSKKDVSGDPKRKPTPTTEDEKVQQELKELIELNEIRAGALKKIMNKLNEDNDNESK